MVTLWFSVHEPIRLVRCIVLYCIVHCIYFGSRDPEDIEQVSANDGFKTMYLQLNVNTKLLRTQSISVHGNDVYSTNKHVHLTISAFKKDPKMFCHLHVPNAVGMICLQICEHQTGKQLIKHKLTLQKLNSRVSLQLQIHWTGKMGEKKDN
jgi:hypothetical protein